MRIDDYLKGQIEILFADFNEKIQNRYFISNQSSKQFMMDDFLKQTLKKQYKTYEYQGNLYDVNKISNDLFEQILFDYKNKIWTAIPEGLIKEGEKNKVTKKRFFCTNGTITREELFALSIVLKLDKDEAIFLINHLFKEMYVNYANPYDLIFDYCIKNQLSVTQYMDYMEEAESFLNQNLEEVYTTKLSQLSDVTKTHQIASQYQQFLESNHTDILSFIQTNQSYFHYYSHYMYKLFYHLLDLDNDFYSKNYISHGHSNKHQMNIEQSNAIRLNQLDRDLRYYLDNMKSYYLKDEFYIDNKHWDVFYEAFKDQFILDKVEEQNKTKGRSLIGVIQANKDINRTLLLVTAILCGKITLEQIDEIIEQVAIIRPEIEDLENHHLVDYWLLQVLNFSEKAKSYYVDDKLVFEQTKLFMKMARVLIGLYLEQIVKNEGYGDVQSMVYCEQLIDYFTNHTKLTYKKGK